MDTTTILRLLTLTAVLIPSVVVFGGVFMNGHGILLSAAASLAGLPIGIGLGAVMQVNTNVVAERCRNRRTRGNGSILFR